MGVQRTTSIPRSARCIPAATSSCTCCRGASTWSSRSPGATGRCHYGAARRASSLGVSGIASSCTRRPTCCSSRRRRARSSVLLEVVDLGVVYGQRRALEGVSLTVAPGEIVTLLGANGSGKSTTLRAISGLVRPRAGTLRYDGLDLARMPADAIVAAGIGHVPEGRDIFGEFSVLENLQVGAHTVPAPEVPPRLQAAYALFPVLPAR